MCRAGPPGAAVRLEGARGSLSAAGRETPFVRNSTETRSEWRPCRRVTPGHRLRAAGTEREAHGGGRVRTLLPAGTVVGGGGGRGAVTRPGSVHSGGSADGSPGDSSACTRPRARAAAVRVVSAATVPRGVHMSALRCCVCPRWVAASLAGHVPCRGADSPSTQHPVPGVRPAPPWPVPPTPRPVSQAGPPGKMPAELAARSRVTSARGNATPCRLESHSVPRGGAGCGRGTRLVLSVLVPPSCGLLLAAGIRLPPSVRPPRGPGRRGLRPLGSRVGEQDVCASGLAPPGPSCPELFVWLPGDAGL